MQNNDFNGLTLFLVLIFCICLIFVLIKLQTIQRRYIFYKDEYHKHDDIKVEVTDLIPYEYCIYNIRFFNLLISINKATVKNKYQSLNKYFRLDNLFSIKHIK